MSDDFPALIPSPERAILDFLKGYSRALADRSAQRPSPSGLLAQLDDQWRRVLSDGIKHLHKKLGETASTTSNTDTDAATPDALGPETRTTPNVAGYDILRVMGQGGMGVAYLARDRRLNREVVIKVLLEKHQQRSELKGRFLAEAQLQARLLHPGIPHVYEVNALFDNRPYVVMKFVDGRTLSDRLKAQGDAVGELPQLLGIFEQICQILAYVHSLGVVHRDLKPDNVMIGAFGEVQVLDWGLAKVLTRPPEPPGEAVQETPASFEDEMESIRVQSQVGDVIGTAHYMAPEAASGKVDLLDERTDVFGLGAILCEILTGAPPFMGEAVNEVLERATRGDLQEAHNRLAACSADYEVVEIALRCLATERDRRPPNAGVVAQAVAAYRNGIEARKREAELERERAEASRGEAEARAAAETRARSEAEARVAAERHSSEAAIAREKAQRRAKRWAISAAVSIGLLAVFVLGFIGYRYGQEQELRIRADQLLADGEESLSKRPEIARDRALAAKMLTEDRNALADLNRQARRLANLADERLENRSEVESKPLRFLRDLEEAEFNILGSLWTFLPHEIPSGKRRIRGNTATGSNLATGIETLTKTLERYQLPDHPDVFAVLPSRGYDEWLVKQLQQRSADGVFLLALAVERSCQGGPAESLEAGRTRAVELLDVAERLGNKTKSLYDARARYLESLGKPDRAARDRSTADSLSPVTFLDHHLLAGEAQRAGKLAEAEQGYQAALGLRPQDYWTLFRLAKTSELQRKYDLAIGLYQSCLSLRPADATAHNNRGELLYRLQRYDLAIVDLRRAVELDQEYFVAVHNLMLALAERKDVAAAREVAEKYRAVRTPSPYEAAELLNDLGIACERSEKLNDALDYYTESTKQDPEFVMPLRNRAILLERLHRFDQAQSDLKKAIALAPNNSDLHYLLGNVFFDMGQSEEALKMYDLALALEPGMENVAYNRGVLLREPLGRFQDAIKSQTQVLSQRPSPAMESMARFERALSFANLKDYRAALEDLNAVVVANPRGTRGLLMRGSVLTDAGDYEGGELDLGWVIRLSPNEPNGYRARGLNRFRAGKWAGAIEDFREYLALQPEAVDTESIRNDISTALLELGNLDEAAAEFQRITAVSLPSSYANRGNLRMMRGRFKEAIADFDAAIQLDDRYTRAWALRGQAQLRLDRFTEAAKDLGKALELEPGHYETMLFHGLAHYYIHDELVARNSLAPIVKDRPQHVRGLMAQGVLQMLHDENSRAIAPLSPAVHDRVLRPFALRLRARCWLKTGDKVLSLALLDAEELATLFSEDSRSQLDAARICALVATQSNETDASSARLRALELLKRSLKLEPELRSRLDIDPELNSLRSAPAFQELTRDE